MGSISKSLALILILFMAISILSLLMVKPATAQTATPASSPVPIPTPSVPKFTVKFVDSSYDVSTTTSIDQYTGKTITNQGYHIENLTIQLTIKNQPFSSYMENGQNISFYYNVREKGHFVDNWVVFYYPDSGYPIESKTDYSTLTYVLGNSSIFGYTPPDAQIDFQVQALIGAVHRIENGSATNQLEMFPWVFDGKTSDWSNTQTVIIPASSTSPSSTPAIPEFPSGELTPATIINNNIYDNSNYNVLSNVTNDVNAANNWWGTTDTQSINQTIYDFKNDHNWCNVSFIPFLDSPNTQAPTFVNASAGDGGYIVPRGYVSVNYGGSQTFTITPNYGYYILDVLVNGTSVGAVSSYTA